MHKLVIPIFTYFVTRGRFSSPALSKTLLIVTTVNAYNAVKNVSKHPTSVLGSASGNMNLS